MTERTPPRPRVRAGPDTPSMGPGRLPNPALPDDRSPAWLQGQRTGSEEIMTAEVISLKPVYRRSHEADLWDAYLGALGRVQSEYPLITVNSCREVVRAWEAFETEINKTRGLR